VRTLRQALYGAAADLERAGCPSPRVDAEHLLAHVLRQSRTALYLDLDAPLGADDAERFRDLVARRERREPLAYILGEWGFRRLTLRVDRRVLIPRPETEIVVERCLELLAGLDEPQVLDVGVGSGAIALAIADEHPSAHVTGLDSSRGALEVARANLAATRLDGRVRLVEHDLRGGGFGAGRFDLVVSNPPYVDEDEIEGLEPEVRDWEPRAALVAPGATEDVARGAREALQQGGWLVLEVADGKAREVASLVAELGYERATIGADLAGRERVVSARKP
jgi:release factor glutamine methyltransferase